MSIIKKQDFIESIADALQFISYYHPSDFICCDASGMEKGKNRLRLKMLLLKYWPTPVYVQKDIDPFVRTRVL